MVWLEEIQNEFSALPLQSAVLYNITTVVIPEGSSGDGLEDYRLSNPLLVDVESGSKDVFKTHAAILFHDYDVWTAARCRRLLKGSEFDPRRHNFRRVVAGRVEVRHFERSKQGPYRGLVWASRERLELFNLL